MRPASNGGGHGGDGMRGMQLAAWQLCM